tara:strand:+ start:1889 stop:2248 length:360 start_codon:yes stop_codon:yes gene_type:complete
MTNTCSQDFKVDVPKNNPKISNSEHAFESRFHTGKGSSNNLISSQKGGFPKYAYIRNPLTGRQVKVTGKIGKKIISNYIIQSGGNPEAININRPDSVFSGDMNIRKFDCNQPYWEPLCL